MLERNKQMAEFYIGGKVKLQLPKRRTADDLIPADMRRYDGGEYTIKKIKRYKIGRSYVLSGMVSPFGNEYECMSDWLIPIREVGTL